MFGPTTYDTTMKSETGQNIVDIVETTSHPQATHMNYILLIKSDHQTILASHAISRYARVPALEDLEGAINQLEAVTEFENTRDDDLHEELPLLAHSYYLRFDRGGCVDDLDKAIQTQLKYLPEARGNIKSHQMTLWRLSDYLERRGLLDSNSQEADRIKSEE